MVVDGVTVTSTALSAAVVTAPLRDQQFRLASSELFMGTMFITSVLTTY